MQKSEGSGAAQPIASRNFAFGILNFELSVRQSVTIFRSMRRVL
jgi:hypothetical protein